MQAERYSNDAVREVAESTAREFGYAHMKSEQLRVVEAFVQGSDVFAILPTGLSIILRGRERIFAVKPATIT